jgi:hypothetical protein
LEIQPKPQHVVVIDKRDGKGVGGEWLAVHGTKLPGVKTYKNESSACGRAKRNKHVVGAYQIKNL